MVLVHLRSIPRGPTFHRPASTTRNSFTVNPLAREKCELHPVEITEWPGGEAGSLDLTVGAADFDALVRGKSYMHSPDLPLGDAAGLPWGSIATINCDARQAYAVTGPARFRRDSWQLPVLWYGAGGSLAVARRESATVIKAFGLRPLA